MRGRRLAVAVAGVPAIVVLGSATTVLISARSQQEKAVEPQVLSQEVPPKKGSANVADTATLGSADGRVDTEPRPSQDRFRNPHFLQADTQTHRGYNTGAR